MKQSSGAPSSNFWSAVCKHRFGLRRSRFLWIEARETSASEKNGFASNQSGADTPHPKRLMLRLRAMPTAASSRTASSNDRCVGSAFGQQKSLARSPTKTRFASLRLGRSAVVGTPPCQSRIKPTKPAVSNMSNPGAPNSTAQHYNPNDILTSHRTRNRMKLLRSPQNGFIAPERD